MNLFISPRGALRFLYGECLDLRAIGPPNIQRASHVEPDAEGNWYADLSPVHGPRLGPFPRRTQAIHAEIDWLERNVLSMSR